MMVDGNVTWIGTSGGLIEFNRNTRKHTLYNNRSGLLSNGVFYVGKIGGEIWVGTYGGGLSVLNPKTRKWRNYNIPQGLGDAFVYDVLETRSGEIWIATWSGANRIVDGKIDNIRSWQLYTVENTGGGLPNDWVYGLAEGKNGEIWMATEGGLARFMDGRWTNWNHKRGLGASYEVVEKDIPFQNDPADYSAHHARQKKEQGLGKVKVAYNPNYVVSLTVDSQGVVWAGTWGGGLSRFDGKNWKTFTVQDGLPGNHVFALKSNDKGVVWVGTSRGLARFDGTRFVRFGRKDGLFSPAVFSVALGKEGEVWVGSFGGAAWFPHGPRSDAAGK
jgi:ligand-binding sensor domain-containing protein